MQRANHRARKTEFLYLSIYVLHAGKSDAKSTAASTLATHARALAKLIHLLAPNFLTLIPSALSL
jgi:hypothetical protein